jgi:hypothetical protein
VTTRLRRRSCLFHRSNPCPRRGDVDQRGRQAPSSIRSPPILLVPADGGAHTTLHVLSNSSIDHGRPKVKLANSGRVDAAMHPRSATSQSSRRCWLPPWMDPAGVFLMCVARSGSAFDGTFSLAAEISRWPVLDLDGAVFRSSGEMWCLEAGTLRRARSFLPEEAAWLGRVSPCSSSGAADCGEMSEAASCWF